eukprot:111834-Rhodomonas_salina.2
MRAPVLEQARSSTEAAYGATGQVLPPQDPRTPPHQHGQGTSTYLPIYLPAYLPTLLSLLRPYLTFYLPTPSASYTTHSPLHTYFLPCLPTSSPPAPSLYLQKKKGKRRWRHEHVGGAGGAEHDDEDECAGLQGQGRPHERRGHRARLLLCSLAL